MNLPLKITKSALTAFSMALLLLPAHGEDASVSDNNFDREFAAKKKLDICKSSYAEAMRSDPANARIHISEYKTCYENAAGSPKPADRLKADELFESGSRDLAQRYYDTGCPKLLKAYALGLRNYYLEKNLPLCNFFEENNKIFGF